MPSGERQAKNQRRRLAMKYEYSYKGSQITVWTKEDSDRKWEGWADIKSGTNEMTYEEFPTKKFDTEQEAIDTVKKLAEYRVDHPRV
jgi:hypothetical protein